MKPEKLIAFAKRSGLLEMRKDDSVLSNMRDSKADIPQIVDVLLRYYGLTKWQCDQLLKGKYLGFFLEDRYMLFDAGERDDTYLALDLLDSKQVTVAVERSNASMTISISKEGMLVARSTFPIPV